MRMSTKLETGVGEPLERSIRPVESIDTFHYDEATRIVADYTAGGGAQQWSESEETYLRRKVDWRVIPILSFSFFMQFYDKSILAQAVRTRQLSASRGHSARLKQRRLTVPLGK